VTWRLDGSPPCSRMERRTAVMSRSSESMVSRSRTADSLPVRIGAAQFTSARADYQFTFSSRGRPFGSKTISELRRYWCAVLVPLCVK
jgi:hypothetical protein